MINKQIAETDRSGLTLAQVDGTDVYKMLPQVQTVLEFGNLGDDYVFLFAEPVDNGRKIDWYVSEGDVAMPAVALPDEERKAVLGRFRDMVTKLHEYAASLKGGSSSGYRSYSKILEKALTVPGI